MITALFTIAYLAASVRAHGLPAFVSIDGVVYAGNIPNSPTIASPVRFITQVGPVKGASNPDLICGVGAGTPAALVANAAPGARISVQWHNGGGGNWPHNTGPMSTYLARCDSTCDTYDPTHAKWFKIDQVGQANASTWWQQGVMSGESFTVSLPQDIAAGDYLMRSEIIALHLGMSVGGAEFYPACTQLRITGSGTGTPGSTVSIPGAFTDTDPGIYVPDIYNPGFTYTFPGPPVSNLAAASASALTAPITSGSASTSSTGSGSGSSGSGSSGSSGSGAQSPIAGQPSCGLKKKLSTQGPRTRRRREMSRVMHRLLREIEELERSFDD